MKILKYIGLVLLSIIFLIVIVSFFLPAASHVERSIVIKSEPSVPFMLINNVKEWGKWSPWHKLDTNMTIVYGDIPEGEGSWYTWKSEEKNVGEGKLMIVKSTPDQYIETSMEFSGMGTSKGSYTFEKTAEGVRLNWAMDNDGKDMPWMMKIPSKYFNLFLDDMVGPDFEKGLHSLKTISEAAPMVETVAGFETEEREIRPMLLAGIRETIKTEDLTSKTFSKWYGQITNALQRNNITPSGPPMAVYYQYGPKEVEVEAAIPVSMQGTDEGKIRFHETATIKAFVVKYYGSYNRIAEVYNEVYAHLKEKGKFSTGAPMEIYVTDPGMEPDSSNWLTEIVFPLD
jgi:effector-binding domain-containing protein